MGMFVNKVQYIASAIFDEIGPTRYLIDVGHNPVPSLMENIVVKVYSLEDHEGYLDGKVCTAIKELVIGYQQIENGENYRGRIQAVTFCPVISSGKEDFVFPTAHTHPDYYDLVKKATIDMINH